MNIRVQGRPMRGEGAYRRGQQCTDIVKSYNMLKLKHYKSTLYNEYKIIIILNYTINGKKKKPRCDKSLNSMVS